MDTHGLLKSLLLGLLLDQIDLALSRKTTPGQFIFWFQLEFLQEMEKSGILTDEDMGFLTNYNCDFSFHEEDAEARDYRLYYGDQRFFDLLEELCARVRRILMGSSEAKR